MFDNSSQEHGGYDRRILEAKTTSIEILNIKQAMEMGVILQEEGKNKVVELLGMKWEFVT